MRGEAKAVHSVDSSAKAIELTNENIALNFLKMHAMRLSAKMPSSILMNMTSSTI